MDEQEKETVDVPVSALVRCPLVEYQLVRVSDCPDCAHFNGLSDRFTAAAEIKFHQRYSVLCAAEPVKREVFSIASILT